MDDRIVSGEYILAKQLSLFCSPHFFTNSFSIKSVISPYYFNAEHFNPRFERLIKLTKGKNIQTGALYTFSALYALIYKSNQS